MSAKGFASELAVRVGARIRKLRVKQKLTQRELAARMAPDLIGTFHRSHVTRLEKGRHLASLELYSAAARALGVKVSSLLTCLDGVRPNAVTAEAAE